MEKDDSYIPVLTRVKFKIQTTKEVESQQELNAIKDEIEEIVKNFQVSLKGKIIEYAKLEETAILLKTNEIYCRAVHDVAVMFMKAQASNTTAHAMLFNIFEQHHATLLQHTQLTKDQFYTLYNKTVGGTLQADNTQQNQQNNGEVKRVIEAVFVTATTHYTTKAKSNEMAITLKKLAKETLSNQATAEAENTVDKELPANREQLQELIRKQAASMAKEMIKKEVAQQIKQSKGNQKGQAGASNKKKSSRRQRSKTPEKKNTNTKKNNRKPNKGQKEKKENKKQKNKKGKNKRQPADGHESDSTNDSSRSSRKHSRSKSRKKTRKSNRGRQQ